MIFWSGESKNFCLKARAQTCHNTYDDDFLLSQVRIWQDDNIIASVAAGTGLGMSRQGIGGSTNDVAVVDNECKHLPECYLGQPESNTSIPERTGRNPELLEISIEEQDHLALTGSKVVGLPKVRAAMGGFYRRRRRESKSQYIMLDNR